MTHPHKMSLITRGQRFRGGGGFLKIQVDSIGFIISTKKLIHAFSAVDCRLHKKSGVSSRNWRCVHVCRKLSSNTAVSFQKTQ